MAEIKQPLRMHSLDVLRGIAVLMVLAAHCPIGAESSVSTLRKILDLGSYGVDLFFVLSGFLISGLLFAEFDKRGALKPAQFWIRRGFKIWPSYYASYGAVFLIHGALLARGDHSIGEYLSRSWPNFLFLQNYIHAESRWPMSWSLAVEEHFYMTLPPVMLALIAATGRLRLLPWCCGAVIIGVPILRYFETDADRIYIQTHFRADALCCGVLLGYWHRYSQSAFMGFVKWWPVLIPLPFMALSLAFAVPAGGALMRTFGFTILAWSFAGPVMLSVARPEFGRQAIPPVSWAFRVTSLVGLYSYTIYLAQPIAEFVIGLRGPRVDRLFQQATGAGQDNRFVAFIVLSLVGGNVMSHLIERPFLALRDRLCPKS